MSTEQSGGGRGGGSNGGNGGNGGNGTDTDVTARIGDPVTDDYLVGLRVALIGLPHTEVAEIVDDARGHLAELAEELGAGYGRDAVHARLGSPQDYAAELRAAAGYPPAQQEPVERPRTGQAGFALAALVVATAAAGAAGLAMGQVGPSTVAPLFLAVPLAAAGALAAWSDGPGQPAAASLPSVVALRERLARARTDGAAGGFVLSLQPGWWVLRALVAAGVIGWVFGGGGSAGLVTALVLAVPAVPLSVLLGRRSAADRRLLWAVVPLNAFAVGLLVAAVLAQGQDRTGDVVSYSPPAGLSLDGATVADVRPFDAKGRPLSEVYLFDENGRPARGRRPLLRRRGVCRHVHPAGARAVPAGRPYDRPDDRALRDPAAAAAGRDDPADHGAPPDERAARPVARAVDRAGAGRADHDGLTPGAGRPRGGGGRPALTASRCA